MKILVNIKCFTALINSRKGRKGEGVGLFLNDNLKYKLKHNLVSDNVCFASLFVQLDGRLSKTKDNIIGVIYKSPDVHME